MESERERGGVGRKSLAAPASKSLGLQTMLPYPSPCHSTPPVELSSRTTKATRRRDEKAASEAKKLNCSQFVNVSEKALQKSRLAAGQVKGKRG